MATRKDLQNAASAIFTEERIINIVNELYAIAMDTNNSTKDRLGAINSILDRFVGKTPDEIIVTAKTNTTADLLKNHINKPSKKQSAISEQQLETAFLMRNELDEDMSNVQEED